MKRRGTDTAETITQLIMQAILWPLEAWALMLTIGIIHHDILPAVQPIGYGWTVFALTSTIPMVTTGTTWMTRRKIEKPS